MDTVSTPIAASERRPHRAMGSARLSDELLARSAARGSERAFAALYERYHQPLYRYCRSILRDDVDAQDALQSTFAGALSALKQRQRSAPLRPWLFRIAHNEAISVIRRRSREQDHLELAAAHPVTGSSAEDLFAKRARMQQLSADLADLPERLRAALLMRELSGLRHEEIAVALGTTVGAAKQAIFEARRALAEFAEGRDMDCEIVRRQLSDGDGRVLRGRRIRAHLRDCAGCEAFAAAISARRAELGAFVPMLPAAAAAALLARATHAAAGHAAAGAAASGVSTTSAGAAASGVSTTSAGAAATATATAGALGKVAGGAAAWKALVGAIVLATATAGVAGVTSVLPHSRGVGPLQAARASLTSGAAAAGGSRTGRERTPASSVASGNHGAGATQAVRGRRRAADAAVARAQRRADRRPGAPLAKIPGRAPATSRGAGAGAGRSARPPGAAVRADRHPAGAKPVHTPKPAGGAKRSLTHTAQARHTSPGRGSTRSTGSRGSAGSTVSGAVPASPGSGAHNSRPESSH